VNCEKCKFSQGHEPPEGECPPPPDPPKGSGGWWYDLFRVDPFDNLMANIQWRKRGVWLERTSRAEKMIQCRRFPVPVDRPKEYCCGEFKRP